MRISRRISLVALFIVLTLSACGGGGGSGGGNNGNAPAPVPPPPAPPTQSTISGSVIKSAIENAEIKVFTFDESGAEAEVVAANAPVKTAADGSFQFTITAADFPADAGPLLVRTFGGTMNLEAAPQLEGLIANSSVLNEGGNDLRSFVTVASSVAAGLLEREVASTGMAPTIEDASAAIAKVEQELDVKLSDDPALSGSGIDYLNLSIDANLNLIEMPANNVAVADLVEYFVLNIASVSGKLDAAMVDVQSGADIAAAFVGVGSGSLANVLPEGPTTFYFVRASLDKTDIENDGFDTAQVSVSATDATGDSIADGSSASVATSAGRLTISNNSPVLTGGAAATNISSVWAGEAVLVAGMTVPAGPMVSANFDVAVVDNVADVVDEEKPRVVSAGSTSNTELVITFTEAMRGGIESAENPAYYRISAADSLVSGAQGKVDTAQKADGDSGGTVSLKPEVVVMAAELILPHRQSVRLTTLSQSDLEYKVTVVNMTDLAGNTMAPREGGDALVDPSVAYFQGSPPSGGEVTDTDGDGLSDHDEQRGWIVTIITAAGQILTTEVTSDPLNPDTDGDGVTDNEEFHGGLNPRTADTDGDTLTDDDEWNTVFSDGLNQDTDGDGVQDGFEYWTFRTSPILADTDGDQISDPDEVIAGNRNPLIADLPSPRIRVGNVNLQLDTRFTFTDEAGSEVTEEASSETTLSRSEDETFSTSNEDSTQQTLGASNEIQAGIVESAFQLVATGSNTRGSEQGNTFSVSEESGVSSEESYNSSLTTSTTRDVRESVTREVLDAAIKVDVSIENTGSLPFTISNLELSALTQDSRNRRRVIPVASLVPENPDLGSINIGALGDSARGPFVFNTVSVFPQQVEELLKSPRGLIVKIANFDITDETGRNFSFISRDVLDRTAGITFDLGDGRVESYRVATASAHNPSNGQPLGISMEYALNGIIGFRDEPTIQDGGNGVVDTTVVGDDIQEYQVGSVVEPGEVIITVGPNGLLDTAGSEVVDDLVVAADYATSANPVTGHQVLTRFRDVETVFADDDTTPLFETRRVWGVFSSKDLPNVDLGNIILRAGDQFDFVFVQDQDNDGVWAREEYLHGSSDLLADTDDDGLSDAEEIQDGWTVQVRTSREALPVYPNPVAADSDRDRLDDIDERSCGIDPRQRDTDLDGLSDYEEIYGVIVVENTDPLPLMYVRDPVSAAILSPVRQYSGVGILDGGNGRVDTLVAGDDILVFSGLAGGIIIEAGPNGEFDSIPNSDPSGDPLSPPDDFYATPHVVFGTCNLDLGISGFATDPLDADTDGDTILDGAELELGINPNNPEDGQTLIDDDGDGLANQVEDDGFLAGINAGQVNVNSNRNVTDTDGDSLSDLLEYYLGSNPQARDTDGDGLLDNQEYSGPSTCVTNIRLSQTEPCIRFDAKIRDSHSDYVRDCGLADICVVDDSIYIGNPGTNLNQSDSDYDGVSDLVEWQSSLVITVDGTATEFPAPASDPLIADTDNDGLLDGSERNGVPPTNPDNQDTDGDGTPDGIEAARGLIPTRKDALVRYIYDSISINGDCDADVFAPDPGEFIWTLRVGSTIVDSRNNSQQVSVDGSREITINKSTDKIMIPTSVIDVVGSLSEVDANSVVDASLSWNVPYTLSKLGITFPLTSQGFDNFVFSTTGGSGGSFSDPENLSNPDCSPNFWTVKGRVVFGF